MPTHAERQVLPYKPEQLFELVLDVAKYPQFLPWCVAARVRSSSDKEVHADMTIGYGPFRESFTSLVTPSRPDRIDVHYEKGPFKYLNNHWGFLPHPDGTEVLLRRLRVQQPDFAGRHRRGVQRSGAPDGRRLP